MTIGVGGFGLVIQGLPLEAFTLEALNQLLPATQTVSKKKGDRKISIEVKGARSNRNDGYSL